MIQKPRRFVRMFQSRFAPLVESGAKCQTIRPKAKLVPIFGDVLSLREWTGKPYRSNQRVLREAPSLGTEGILIESNGVQISPGTLRCFYMGENSRRSQLLEEFARADGFADWSAMRDWFQKTHGLPFEGSLIKWEPPINHQPSSINPA